MREWIVGRNPVYEVLAARRRHAFHLLLAQGVSEKGRLGQAIRLCSERKIPLSRVPRQKLDTFASGHQGVALEVSGYPYVSLQEILVHAASTNEAPFILILDALQDPQNLGALLRTAECTGVHGVLLPLRHSATVTPAVVGASSGASEHMLVSQVNLAQAIVTLKQAEVWVVGLEDSPQALPVNQARLDGPLALVVGSEGQGMRALVRDSCDFLVRLPMRGRIDSLNAAVAGSVALYLAWQARGFNHAG